MDHHPSTREQWAADFRAKAAAYWTPSRLRGLLGDKHLLLHPVTDAPLLRALGLLRRDASMGREVVRKFMQVSHMVALLEPLLLDLVAARPVVRILDAACGSSHLTLILAWCFLHRYQHPAAILGIDRNADLLAASRDRARSLALEDRLHFVATTLEELDLAAVSPHLSASPVHEGGSEAPETTIDLLLALHACDTATDAALAFGLAHEAQVMAVAPCCHAELARGWADLAAAGADGPLASIWGAPHLRREAAATMTDALRMLLLRACGYTVTPMEFVPSTHTPKNTLLRAVRRQDGEADDHALGAYVGLRAALGGIAIDLEHRLSPHHQARLDAALTQHHERPGAPSAP